MFHDALVPFAERRIIRMKRINKHVGCWDKDKRDSGNCFRNYNGNYTEKDENMENFNFDVWLREMLHR